MPFSPGMFKFPTFPNFRSADHYCEVFSMCRRTIKAKPNVKKNNCTRITKRNLAALCRRELDDVSHYLYATHISLKSCIQPERTTYLPTSLWSILSSNGTIWRLSWIRNFLQWNNETKQKSPGKTALHCWSSWSDAFSLWCDTILVQVNRYG